MPVIVKAIQATGRVWVQVVVDPGDDQAGRLTFDLSGIGIDVYTAQGETRIALKTKEEA